MTTGVRQRHANDRDSTYTSTLSVYSGWGWQLLWLHSFYDYFVRNLYQFPTAKALGVL